MVFNIAKDSLNSMVCVLFYTVVNRMSLGWWTWSLWTDHSASWALRKIAEAHLTGHMWNVILGKKK